MFSNRWKSLLNDGIEDVDANELEYYMLSFSDKNALDFIACLKSHEELLTTDKPGKIFLLTDEP